jgi:DNA-binding XRE family transcriptional regulator
MNSYHLTAVGPLWALIRDSITLREFRNRWQAIDECPGILGGESCSLFIHGTDGTVEAVRTFSEFDPPVVRNAIRRRPCPPISRRRPANDGGLEAAAGTLAGRARRSLRAGQVRNLPFLSAEDRALHAKRIGALILSRRVQQGLSRKELASVLGASKWTIKEWEKGRSFPDKFRKQVTEWFGPEGESVFSPGGESPSAVEKD